MSKTHLRESAFDYFEEEDKLLLFSSILKRLQSEVSQHGGDTYRGAVSVILVDEASYTSRDVSSLSVSFCWYGSQFSLWIRLWHRNSFLELNLSTH